MEQKRIKTHGSYSQTKKNVDTHLLKVGGIGLLDSCTTAVDRLKKGPWSKADTKYFIAEAEAWPEDWYHFIDSSYYIRD